MEKFKINKDEQRLSIIIIQRKNNNNNNNNLLLWLKNTVSRISFLNEW